MFRVTVFARVAWATFVVLALLLTLLTAASPSVHAAPDASSFAAGAASTLNVEGLSRGISWTDLSANGATLLLQLSGGNARFATALTDEQRLAYTAGMFDFDEAIAGATALMASSGAAVDVTAAYADAIRNLAAELFSPTGHMGTGNGGVHISVHASGRSLRLELPRVSTVAASLLSAGVRVPLKAPPRELLTPTSGVVALAPGTHLVLAQSLMKYDTPNAAVIAGEGLQIQLEDASVAAVNRSAAHALRLVRGRDCRGVDAGDFVPLETSSSSTEPTTSSFVAYPIGGSELFVVCYAPFGAALDGVALVAAGPRISVSGATPSKQRMTVNAGERVDIQVVGFNLTEYDAVAVMPSGRCDDLASGAADSAAVEQALSAILDLILPSSNVMELGLVVPSAGDFDLCYRHADSELFVPVSAFSAVQGRKRIPMISASNGQSIELSTDLTASAVVIGDGGTIRLNSHRVNTSRFEWRYGGALEGYGSIYCMDGDHVIDTTPSSSIGSDTIANGDSAPTTTTTTAALADADAASDKSFGTKKAASAIRMKVGATIHNYGHMTVRLSQLRFYGLGALINHRRLTIIVASQDAVLETESTLTASGIHGIVNAVGGIIDVVADTTGSAASSSTMRDASGVDSDDSSASLSTAGPFRLLSGDWANLGDIHIHPRVYMRIGVLQNARAASVTVASTAQLLVQGGQVAGTVAAAVDSNVGFVGAVWLHETHLILGQRANVVIETTHDASRVVSMEGVAVTGPGHVYLRGPSAASLLFADGRTSISSEATLYVKNVSIVARSAIAYLDVGGKLVMHVPSVVLGDNLVLSAKLHAVLYGEGEEARVTPQYVPRNNTAFQLPPNATLVLMDLTQTGDAVAPSLCSRYLVVPVHVRLSGLVQLHGCVLLPVGGEHTADIFGASAAFIETTARYAFCKSLLKSSAPSAATEPEFVAIPTDVCVPLFSTSARTPTQEAVGSLATASEASDADDATQSADPINDAVPAAGALVLAGRHVMGEIASTDMLPRVALQHIEIVGASRIEAHNAVRVLVELGVIVGRDATLHLARGGYVGGTLLTVEGILQLDAAHPLLVNATLSLSGSLEVSYASAHTDQSPSTALVPVSGQYGGHVARRTDHQLDDAFDRALQEAATRCQFPLIVTGRAHFGEWSQFTCLLNGSVEALSVLPIIRASDLSGRPNFNCSVPTGTPGEVESYSPISRYGDLGLSATPRVVWPTPARRTVAVLTMTGNMCAIAIVFICLMGSTFFRELRRRPPFVMQLEATELRSYALNYIAILLLVHEYLVLSAPALHPDLVYPHWMSPVWMFISGGTSFYLQLHPSRLEQKIVLPIVYNIIFIWSHLRLGCYLVRESALSERQYYWYRLCKNICKWLTFIGFAAFVPVVSMLMDPVACYGLLMSSPEVCAVTAPLLIPSTIALIYFIILVPFSNVLLHPPYMNHIDLRYKRTFVALHCVLMTATVGLWKIFSRQVLELQLCNIAMVVMMALLNHYSHPCAYENINVHRTLGFIVPIGASVAALVQALQADGVPSFHCGSDTVSATVYCALLILTVVVYISAVVWQNLRADQSRAAMRFGGRDGTDMWSGVGASGPARFSELAQQDEHIVGLEAKWRRLHVLRDRMHDAARRLRMGNMREVYALERRAVDAAAEYHARLQEFRMDLDRCLMPFYGHRYTDLQVSAPPSAAGTLGASVAVVPMTAAAAPSSAASSLHPGQGQLAITATSGSISSSESGDAHHQGGSSGAVNIDGPSMHGAVIVRGGGRGRGAAAAASAVAEMAEGQEMTEIATISETNEITCHAPPATAEDVKELTPVEMASYIEGPLLGSGTYGTVHMGMLSIGKLVAVKVVPIGKKQQSQREAVMKEVDVLRTLSHPNIIKYFGCYYPPRKNSLCIFMELATHGSLTQLVRKFGSLSEAVMIQYTRQILDGLKYLHDRRVIHRDIKGENILIDGTGTAKLADFGCSKALAEATEHRSQKGCASLVGSPYWMAPEVIRNESYGTKADIWSVGCTVVEMLNGGQPPWSQQFDNVFSAMFYIGSSDTLPTNIPSDVSDVCRSFLERCFDRDIARRATVDELLSHPWVTQPTDYSAYQHAVGAAAAAAASGADGEWDALCEAGPLPEPVGAHPLQPQHHAPHPDQYQHHAPRYYASPPRQGYPNAGAAPAAAAAAANNGRQQQHADPRMPQAAAAVARGPAGGHPQYAQQPQSYAAAAAYPQYGAPTPNTGATTAGTTWSGLDDADMGDLPADSGTYGDDYDDAFENSHTQVQFMATSRVPCQQQQCVYSERQDGDENGNCGPYHDEEQEEDCGGDDDDDDVPVTSRAAVGIQQQHPDLVRTLSRADASTLRSLRVPAPPTAAAPLRPLHHQEPLTAYTARDVEGDCDEASDDEWDQRPLMRGESEMLALSHVGTMPSSDIETI